MLVNVVERITQKLELIVLHLRCRNCGIIRRGTTSLAQDAYFLERNEIGLVGLNLLGDGGRPILWIGGQSLSEKLSNRVRSSPPLKFLGSPYSYFES